MRDEAALMLADILPTGFEIGVRNGRVKPGHRAHPPWRDGGKRGRARQVGGAQRPLLSGTRFEFQFQFPALLQQLTPVNAVVQRRTCTFADKALNAQAAGAEAVIIINQGNSPDREDLIVGTLAPAEPTIPVVGASFANGAALAQPGSTAHVRVDPSETRTDLNVIAELPGKNADNVVMAGAHLDSIAKGLSEAERDRIALYLNYDMVGSPNYIFMVYDADQSTFEAPVIDNGNLHALEVNSDLIAFAQLTFAFSTESVNGVPGRKVPGPPVNLPPPAGPEGTFASAGGGQGPGPIES